MKKMRRIAPRVMPKVRMMAMWRPFSFTSMIRPETMFSATMTKISDRMMNITLASTFSAEMKLPLARCQFQRYACAPISG